MNMHTSCILQHDSGVRPCEVSIMAMKLEINYSICFQSVKMVLASIFFMNYFAGRVETFCSPGSGISSWSPFPFSCFILAILASYSFLFRSFSAFFCSFLCLFIRSVSAFNSASFSATKSHKFGEEKTSSAPRTRHSITLPTLLPTLLQIIGFRVGKFSRTTHRYPFFLQINCLTSFFLQPLLYLSLSLRVQFFHKCDNLIMQLCKMSNGNPNLKMTVERREINFTCSLPTF